MPMTPLGQRRVTFLVRKPGPHEPGIQVFWSLTCCTSAWAGTGKEAEGPWLQPAPALHMLSLGCWHSQGGLNEGKLIAGDSFGPDSMTELQGGGGGGDTCLARGLSTSHASF